MDNSSLPLDDLLASVLQRRASQNRFRQLTVAAPGAIDFSSNGYLCLATNAEVRASFLGRLLQQQSSLALGSGGSRLLDGNTATVERLEASIAAFHGAGAGLLFNSGFDANTGLFGSVPGPDDVVVYDELIHASVHDGLRQSRARRAMAFGHNCIWGKEQQQKKQQSEKQQQKQQNEQQQKQQQNEQQQQKQQRQHEQPSLAQLLSALAHAPGNVFVAVESVYSMDGDLAPLNDIVACMQKLLPRGNGYLVVDEAHATGWLGDQGRGLVNHLGLEKHVWARIHTFGKALGCGGGAYNSFCVSGARRLDV
ncbi:hypothetical protein CDD82_7022 [Ophiocordyceps australis]|uniref:Aminotransferase class I/classII large domain-containing protein n=1 Tax=Ophiocordyceps australis TaxID=1399860 RepID=A0A2C5YPA2_9HYPO|nr:hypothetical protein CDD82_7022 [Ophiocordyceps australis]